MHAEQINRSSTNARRLIQAITTVQMDHLCYWLERGGRHLDNWNVLKDLFPYDGMLFRGLGFNSDAERAEQLERLSDGTLTDAHGSSWSTSSEVAQKFTHTSFEESKWMAPGFVICTEDRGVALFRFCECLASIGRLPKHLSFLPQEMEVALPPGSYKIRILDQTPVCL